jgi:hypothetical protein
LKNNFQALIAAAERLKRNPAEYLLIKAHIAHTYLDCATTTGDTRSRRRSLQRAAGIVQSIEQCLEKAQLLPAQAADVRRRAAELRERLLEAEQCRYPLADAAAANLRLAVRLAPAETVFRFVPSKQPLFADLAAMSERFKYAARGRGR